MGGNISKPAILKSTREELPPQASSKNKRKSNNQQDHSPRQYQNKKQRITSQLPSRKPLRKIENAPLIEHDQKSANANDDLFELCMKAIDPSGSTQQELHQQQISFNKRKANDQQESNNTRKSKKRAQRRSKKRLHRASQFQVDNKIIDNSTTSNRAVSTGEETASARDTTPTSESTTTTSGNTTSTSEDTTPTSEDTTVLILSSDDEDEDVTENYNHQDSQDQIILRCGSILLGRSDLERLNEGQWLNDQLVDFYMMQLEERFNKKKKVYVFNSLFFDKLRSIRESASQDYYGETIRWFKNDSLSDKKIWIIPVCDSDHWYIIAVTRLGSKKPAIIVMDSLKKQRYNSVELITKFLKQRYEAEHNKNFKRAIVNIADIPQQDNGYDCGLYALRSATMLLAKRKQTIKLAKNTLSQTKTDHLLNVVKVPKRTEIRMLINVCINKRS